jgi:hypothetical protein
MGPMARLAVTAAVAVVATVLLRQPRAMSFWASPSPNGATTGRRLSA